MLSILVYSSDGDFIHRCDVEDMQELLRVFRTELQPRYSDGTFDVSISGEILLVEPVKGPPSVAPSLTERQRQILQLMARSFAPKQIASELDISEATVRMHINALKKRFNADSRDQLMAIVGALELCDPFDKKGAKRTAVHPCTDR
ncbi:helix-turn-helix domain-containing protein [Raoultibacter phocaeensis]|uniref:helix-turn-helix domain-containing protein n=1 Tax=Raoultibacter phocaeensis TaxID=2479841 RepID=UPI001119783D|nr:helix-turn-helix transcriptional regulator [Raoultibacter phocaeensis]